MLTYGSAALVIGQRLLSTRSHTSLHLEKIMDGDATLTAWTANLEIRLTDVPVDKRVDGIQPLIITNGLMMAPTPGAHSLLYALLNRNMVWTDDPEDAATITVVAAQFAQFFANYTAEPLEPYDLYEWLRNLHGGLRTREIRAMVDEHFAGELNIWTVTELTANCPTARLQEISDRGNTMFSKIDEVKIGKSMKGGRINVEDYLMNARTIQAVQIQVQVETQPWILSATERFKMAIEKPIDIVVDGNTTRFWFQYASGMDGPQLSAWFGRASEQALAGYVCCIVMGDDSYTIRVVDGVMQYMGIDYKHFDQSIKKEMLGAEYGCLLAMGVPQGVIDILKTVSTNHAIYKSRGRQDRASLKFKPSGPQRITGGPDTSLGNSICNIVGLAIAISRGLTDEAWKSVGFVAKTVVSADPLDIIFLRGVFWLNNDGQHHWGQLPSFVLKAGKMQKTLTRQAHLERMAYAQGRSMGEIPSDFPVLASLKRKLIELGREDVRPPPYPVGSPYQPTPDYSPEGIDREQILAWMRRRYACTDQQIEEVEWLITGVTSLPWFIGHELFAEFMVDYA
jgi:hypothetical protein